MRFDAPGSRGSGAAFSGTDGILIASLGLAFLALLIWLVTPAPPVGYYWDDGWYLLMAEWLSGRSEYRDLAWSMLHLRQYPPGYPALLAAVGAGLERPEAGFFVNALAAALAATILMTWMRRDERFPMVATVAAGALLAIGPVALTWLPALFSEHFFVLLTATALWLAAVARKPQAWTLLGLIVGVAIITRSAGAALLLAVVISAALTNWRRLPWLALGLLPALAAGWWLTADLPSVPRYRASLSQLDRNILDPGYLGSQFVGLARGWSGLCGSTIGGLIALLAVVPGLWLRIRRHTADAWLIPLTLLMLLIWPFPGHMSRFLWPLMPALLVCIAETARLVQRKPLRVTAETALPLILALGLYDGAIRTVIRAWEAPSPQLQSISRMHEWTRGEDPAAAEAALRFRQGLLLDMQQIQTNVPPRSCVYSEYPALVAVQAKRACIASPWQQLSDLGTHRLQCEYYYLVPLALPGTDARVIREAAADHEILFQSKGVGDQANMEATGVLFRLDRSVGKNGDQ